MHMSNRPLNTLLCPELWCGDAELVPGHRFTNWRGCMRCCISLSFPSFCFYHLYESTKPFFSINRCLVCQAATQLHAVQEFLKQQWLIWWIFKIKCLSVNHRFHAMEILSKMFRFEAKVIPKRQSMTIFCNLSRWLIIKNPFGPACLVVTAMLKSGILIFLFSHL